MMLLSQV